MVKYKDFYNHLFESAGINSMDEKYFELIKNPKDNAQDLQKMILEYAKTRGYNIQASHSTNSKPFTVFKTGNLSAHFGSKAAALDRASILKNFSINVVKRHHNEARVLDVVLRIENSLDMPDLASLYQSERGEFIPFNQDESDNDGEQEDRRYPASWESETDFQEWLVTNDVISSDDFWDVQYDKDKAVEVLKRDGYDGISYENVVEDRGSISYIIFSPNQVKLIDLITYDDNKEIIPLSQRFDVNKEDMRY